LAEAKAKGMFNVMETKEFAIMELAVNYDIKAITFHAVKDGKTLCGRKINFGRKKTNHHQGWYLQQSSEESITCKKCKQIALSFFKVSFGQI
jgi:hypothetical protein